MQVTRHVQTEWPLRQLASLQSPFEEHVYHTFLQMGYTHIHLIAIMFFFAPSLVAVLHLSCHVNY